MSPPAQPAPEGATMQKRVPTNYPWLETAHFRPTNSDTLLLAWVRNDSVTYRTGRYLNEKFSGSQETEFRTQPNYYREVTGLFMMSDEGDKLRARCERLEEALKPAAYAIRALRSTIETIDSDERDRARKERRLPLIHTSVLNESRVALEDALDAVAQPEDGK